MSGLLLTFMAIVLGLVSAYTANSLNSVWRLAPGILLLASVYILGLGLTALIDGERAAWLGGRHELEE